MAVLLFSGERSHEVKNVPKHLQGWLFKPEKGPVWAAR